MGFIDSLLSAKDTGQNNSSNVVGAILDNASKNNSNQNNSYSIPAVQPNYGFSSLNSLGVKTPMPVSTPAPTPTWGIQTPQTSVDSILSNSTAQSTKPNNMGSSSYIDSGGKTVEDLLQAVPRDIVSGAMTVAQGFNPSSVNQKVTADSPIMKYILSDEPIGGLAPVAANYEKSIKDSPFAQKYGLDKLATPLGVLGAVVPVALDAWGIGGAEKTASEMAIKSIAKDVVPESIATTIRKTYPDLAKSDLVEPISQALSKESSITKTQSVIEHAVAIEQSKNPITNNYWYDNLPKPKPDEKVVAFNETTGDKQIVHTSNFDSIHTDGEKPQFGVVKKSDLGLKNPDGTYEIPRPVANKVVLENTVKRDLVPTPAVDKQALASVGQKTVTIKKGEIFELGSTGLANRDEAMANNVSTFPRKELPNAIQNSDAVFRASSEPKSPMYNDQIHISQNGDNFRAVHTQKNINGNQEILGWQNIPKKDINGFIDSMGVGKNLDKINPLKYDGVVSLAKSEAEFSPIKEITNSAGQVLKYDKTIEQVNKNSSRLLGRKFDILGTSNTEILGGGIKDGVDSTVLGRARNDLIGLLSQNKLYSEAVANHENWHIFKQNLSTAKRAELDKLELQFAKENPDRVAIIKKEYFQEKGQSNADYEKLVAEEVTADEFARYNRTGKTVSETIKQFFETAAEFFQTLFKHRETILGKIHDEMRNVKTTLKEHAGVASVGEGANKQILSAEEFKNFNDLSTKLLGKLEGKKVVSKQFISDLTNSGDLKQSEKDLFRHLLEGESDKINVKEFADKVKSELLPLNIKGKQQVQITTAEAEKKLKNKGILFEQDMSGDANMVDKNGDFIEYDNLSKENQNLVDVYLGEAQTYHEIGNPLKYEYVNLPPELRGPVANYDEHIYQSPIETSAGNIHFSGEKNYFAHSRVEDLVDDSVLNRIESGKYANTNPNYNKEHPGTTRRVLEIQSDLFQKGRLEKEKRMDLVNETRAGNLQDFSKLEPYRNTWHERIVREEVKKAAQDGKTVLQFPTGETAMKIEGLGQTNVWRDATPNGNPLGTARHNHLTEADLKVGKEVKQNFDSWIITDVLGEGKFKAVPKDLYEGFQKSQQPLSALERQKESFDISGKVNKENPIYKFYEKEMARYLKNKYGAELVTDAQGVTWNQIKIDPKMAESPVDAFMKRSDNKAHDDVSGSLLATEAKKYKSEATNYFANPKNLKSLTNEEDFIKAHTLYHGANTKFADQLENTKKFNPGAKRDAGTGGNFYGLSATTDYAMAKDFSTSVTGKGRVVEVYIDPKAKVLNLKNKALDDLSEKETKQLSKTFDVIRDIDNIGGENETRILNSNVLRDKNQIESAYYLQKTGVTDLYKTNDFGGAFMKRENESIMPIDRLIAEGKVRVVSRDGRDVYQVKKGDTWVNKRDESSTLASFELKEKNISTTSRADLPAELEQKKLALEIAKENLPNMKALEQVGGKQLRQGDTLDQIHATAQTKRFENPIAKNMTLTEAEGVLSNQTAHNAKTIQAARIVKRTDLDSMVTEMGYSDITEADQAYQNYLEHKSQIKESEQALKEEIRNNRQEVSHMNQKQQSDFVPPAKTPTGSMRPIELHPNNDISRVNNNTKNKVDLKITGKTNKQRVDSAIVNSERIKNEISIKGKDAYSLGAKLSPKDIRLAEQYEHGVSIPELAKQAENPAQLQKFLTKTADYYDFRLAADRSAGGTTKRVENYLPHNWDLSKPEDLAKFNELATQKGLLPYNGFHAQPRVFSSYAEGEQLGFTRKYPNILGDLKNDYGSASNIISKQVLRQELEKAVPKGVSLSGYGKTEKGKPFINSNIPGLEGISYHPDIHAQLKGYNALSNIDVFKAMKEAGFNIKDTKTFDEGWDALKHAGTLNTVGTLYDHSSTEMKHFMLNFSGFHSINISTNYAGASIFNPVKGVKGLATSIPSFFSEKVTNNIIEGFKTKMVTGQNFSVFDAGLRSGVNMDRGLPAIGKEKLNPMNALSRAMFDRELHTLKLNLVDQVFSSGKVLPESVKGRALAKEINMIMGELNLHTMNINPNVAKWGSRFLLAPHFTVSKYKLIGDALSKGGEQGGNLARTAILGKSIVMGTLATLGTLLATGKFPNLYQTLLNYTVDPTSQTNLKNPKGQQQDIGYPQTFVTEPVKPVLGALNALGAPFGNKDDLTHYAEARLAPALSDAIAMYTNKDYFGNPIIDPNSPDSKTSQFTKNVLEGDLPIGVQALLKLNEGKITGTQAAINIAGLRTKLSNQDPASVKYQSIDQAKQAIANISGDDPARKEKMQEIFNSLDPASRKSLAYQEMMTGINTKGIYTSESEKKYYQVQDLVKAGKMDEAIKMTEAMTPKEYSAYKSIKTRLEHVNTYQNVLDLMKQGKTDEASKITSDMSQAEYSSYLNYKDKINNPKNPPKVPKTTGLLEKIGTYFDAATTNPAQTFHDIWNGQAINGTKNGAITVDRMSLIESAQIKQSLLQDGQKASDYELDHIVPLTLGGTNEKSNLKLVPIADAKNADKLEIDLGKALGSGKIDAKTAVQTMLDFKNGKITDSEARDVIK